MDFEIQSSLAGAVTNSASTDEITEHSLQMVTSRLNV